MISRAAWRALRQLNGLSALDWEDIVWCAAYAGAVGAGSVALWYLR